MGKTIHLKGGNATNFIAIGLVDSHGKAALDKCSGPMRVAVENELNRRAKEQTEPELSPSFDEAADGQKPQFSATSMAGFKKVSEQEARSVLANTTIKLVMRAELQEP